MLQQFTSLSNLISFQKLKGKARQLKSVIVSLYYACQHPDVGMLPKLVIAFTLGYALSPIDLIPDFIPILGYLDDLIIVPALITLSIKLIPKTVMSECRARAQNEPIRLKNNWIFGMIFIAIWISLAIIVLRKMIGWLKIISSG